MKNQKIFITIMTVIVAVQSVFDAFKTVPLPESATMWIGISGMLIGIIATGIKNYLDPAIANGKNLAVTICLFIAFIAGGVLDQLNVFHLSEVATGYVRLVLTLIVTIIGVVSKTLFPDENVQTK